MYIIHKQTHNYIYIYIYTYMYMYICHRLVAAVEHAGAPVVPLSLFI